MFKLTCMAFHPFLIKFIALRTYLDNSKRNRQMLLLFERLQTGAVCQTCLLFDALLAPSKKKIRDWRNLTSSTEDMEALGNSVARFICSEGKVLVYLRRTVSKSQKVHINVRSNIMLKKTRRKHSQGIHYSDRVF